MRWYTSSLGKKFIMGITGLLMVGFVVAHMLGNLSIFGGADGINAYAEHLRAFPPMLWIFRLVMLVSFGLHILTWIDLYLQNRAARPVNYATKVYERTTFMAQTMIWTGLLLGSFVVFHILHLTMHIGNPQFAEMADALGRFDVFAMLQASFGKFYLALLYVGAMVVLLLHLSHGIQSFFQSLGLTNDNTLPVLEKGGKVVAFVLMVGFMLIPITILFGVVK